jgi:hypothetical protein
MFDLFEVVWGLRNATDHGADPATQRMIRLTKAERAIRRLYRAIDELPSHERFPLVTRWKIYSPKLLLLRNAGSLTPKLTYPRVSDTEAYLPRLSRESSNRKSFAITQPRNTPRIHRYVRRVPFPSRFLPVSSRELSELPG